MNKTLLKKEFLGNYKLLLIFAAVLTMYGCMIISMFDPKLGESLQAMAQSMPGIFEAFGMLDTGSTLVEFLANYLYGFLLVVFPLVFIILLSTRLVARYIDRGSMACLLATPNSRRKIICTQAAVLALFVLVLDGFSFGLYCAVSASMFPGALDVLGFLLVNTGMLGLHLLFAGLCFCSVCVFTDIRYAMGAGTGICIAFVLLQMVARVGDKFDWLKHLTPLTLFDPKALAASDSQAILMTLPLYVAGLLLFIIGITVFQKKDLPL